MIDWSLRLIIAGVFAWSAFGKLRRPGDPLVADPGIPPRIAAALTPVLAIVEAIVAALVVIPATHVLGGICTAVIGAVFTAVLASRWVRGGTRLRCRCFGSQAEHPAWLVTSRAAVVMLAGVLIAADVGAGVSHTALIDAALIVLAVVVAMLVVLVLAMYRQVGVLERRLGPRTALEIPDEGPPFGVPAPELAGLRGAGSELIAFGSDRCPLCRELAPGFRALTRGGLGIRGVDEDADPEAFARFRVPGTPYVVHTYDGVVVAKGLVNTLEQVEELVALGLERAQHAR
jgi:hypothetical protein